MADEGPPSISHILRDDQEKALCFYTDVVGFVKKADFTPGPFRWLTVASAEEPDGAEPQLALNGRNRSWEAAGLLELLATLERGDLPKRD